MATNQLAGRGTGAGPVADYCRALRELRLASGVDAAALARQLGLSKAQLYAILNGQVKRPPDWDKFVRPFVSTCTHRDAAALAQWRRRHDVVIGVSEEVQRRERLARQAAAESTPELEPAASSVPLRFSLPPDLGAFTGRAAELEQIAPAAHQAGDNAGPGTGRVAAIRALAGMPGAGKTALAVHAAHLLADQFPDRQLFVDLHAHTPGRHPVTPKDALAGLLAAAGVDPRHLPADLEGRSALWRDRMAGQRVLLVLDNAASSSQVAPLLPGSPDCLVLVTSRRQLADLPGAVVPVQVTQLPAEQAQLMFTRLAPQAAAGDPAALAELVQLAGYLPLAISLLARLAARHPAWSLADLVAETRTGLLALTAEHTSVGAAFELSWQHLDPELRSLFACLGLHPGTSADAYSAAAVGGLAPATAAGLLDRLHAEGLLTETGHRRYGMHDLISQYATERAAATMNDVARQQALGRLLDYYQHAALQAEAQLARLTSGRIASTSATPAVRLGRPGEALAWARLERANLLACLSLAADAGQGQRVVALTAGLASLLHRDGPAPEAVALHAAAASAAHVLGDARGQAGALLSQSEAQRLDGDCAAAAATAGQALTLYGELDDRLGQANALTVLGDARRASGDYRDAAPQLERALRMFEELGSSRGRATALVILADVLLPTADYAAAVKVLDEASGVIAGLGDPAGQAQVLHVLADVHRVTGRFGAALAAAAQAVTLQEQLDDLRGYANALCTLGNIQRTMGDGLAAVQAASMALAVFAGLGERSGLADALSVLGAARQVCGDCDASARALEAALAVYRDLGLRHSEAVALCWLGTALRSSGSNAAARAHLAAALRIFRDVGDKGGEAEALYQSAAAHLAAGQLARSRDQYRLSLDLSRQIGGRAEEAHALAGLGRCARADGDQAGAVSLLSRSLQILRRIEAPEADGVAAELSALSDGAPAGPAREELPESSRRSERTPGLPGQPANGQPGSQRPAGCPEAIR
jgi:tetratricopeptide (TPR) repeat protein/transcriptional regulator with XRE-family HTH domain